MSDNDIAGGGRVISVLLADGWHLIVPGSFQAGPLAFGAGPEHGVPGFRFEEADTGSPYQPTTLAGPLDSIIAVRQATPAVRGVNDPDRAAAVRGGHRAGHGARPPVPTGRRAALRNSP
jgi:hypothetical protein